MLQCCDRRLSDRGDSADFMTHDRSGEVVVVYIMFYIFLMFYNFLHVSQHVKTGWGHNSPKNCENLPHFIAL